MKKATVGKVITKKMDSWVESIENKALRAEVKSSIVVTGGCIASMLLGEKVNDFDIYMDDAQTCAKLCEYYLSEVEETKKITVKISDDEERVKCVVKSAGFVKFDVPEDEEGFKVAYITENALTLTNDIQIVTRFVGCAEELHKNYDFIHATNYWTYKDGLVTNLRALESLLSKTLYYSGSKYPLCSILRAKKFINRDWTINAGQYLKMCMQLNELDLKDIDVLKEQLVGVDSAYFNHFLSLIAKDDLQSVDMTYIVDRIDEVFEN